LVVRALGDLCVVAAEVGLRFGADSWALLGGLDKRKRET